MWGNSQPPSSLPPTFPSIVVAFARDDRPFDVSAPWLVVVGSLWDVVIASHNRMGVNVDVTASADAHGVDAGDLPEDVRITPVITLKIGPPLTSRPEIFAEIIRACFGHFSFLFPLIRFQIGPVSSPVGRRISSYWKVREQFQLGFHLTFSLH